MSFLPLHIGDGSIACPNARQQQKTSKGLWKEVHVLHQCPLRKQILADKSRSKRNQALAGGSDHSRGLESARRKGRDLGRRSTVQLPIGQLEQADAAPEDRFVLVSAKL